MRHWLCLGRQLTDSKSAIPVRRLRRPSGRYPAVNGPWGQPHRHLQLAPLPLVDDGPAVPMEAAFGDGLHLGDVVRAAALPFNHALARLDGALFDEPATAGVRLLETCRALLAAVGVGEAPREREFRQSGPYNLLLTRRWMMAVPRSVERFERISVNALGYAGSLFVKDGAQMPAIRRAGPMAVLERVSLSRE